MDFLSNPWVVGVGGGILSGSAVAIGTRFFLGRRENREYAQKIRRANQEVVYAIRPGISEGCLPSVAVVQSLINSTARRMGVDSGDIYTPEQIAEELTKEVMDSSFLAAGKKQEYCEHLTTSLAASSRAEPAAMRESKPERISLLQADDYRRRTAALASGLLGTMTALISVIWVLAPEFNGNQAGTEQLEKLVLSASAAAASVALGIGLRGLLRLKAASGGNRNSGSARTTGTLCPECREPLGPFEASCGSCGFTWSK